MDQLNRQVVSKKYIPNHILKKTNPRLYEARKRSWTKVNEYNRINGTRQVRNKLSMLSAEKRAEQRILNFKVQERVITTRSWATMLPADSPYTLPYWTKTEGPIVPQNYIYCSVPSLFDKAQPEFNERISYEALVKEQLKVKQAIIAQLQIAEAVLNRIITFDAGDEEQFQIKTVAEEHSYAVNRPTLIPLRLAYDPVQTQSIYKQAPGKIWVSNCGRWDKIQLTAPSDEITGVQCLEFSACMIGFNHEVALRNLHELSDHFIGVFRHLYNKLPEDSLMPPQMDIRCNMIASHLIQWQLYAIFAPQEIKIDIFELFKMKACALIYSNFHPTGYMTKHKNAHFRLKPFKQSGSQDAEKLIKAAQEKLTWYFRLSPESHRGRHGYERVIIDFEAVWREVIPEPHASDPRFRERITSLIKIRHMTYNVRDTTMPFENSEHSALAAVHKLALYKQIKRLHGI